MKIEKLLANRYNHKIFAQSVMKLEKKHNVTLTVTTITDNKILLYDFN